MAAQHTIRFAFCHERGTQGRAWLGKAGGMIHSYYYFQFDRQIAFHDPVEYFPL